MPTFSKQLIAYTTRLERGEDIDGGELAMVLQRLAEHEVEEGGPYAITVRGGRDGADVGLNLAVACFLRACEVELPKLDAFLQQSLAVGPVSSVLLDEQTLASLVERYTAPTAGESLDTALEYNEREARVMAAIRYAAAQRFGTLSPDLARAGHEVVERTISSNRDKQMSLMAHYVREALGKQGAMFTDSYIAQLGLANICYWAAFVIYDDFWDEDEAAEPRLLPVANLFARHYTDHFSHLLPAETGYRTFFHGIMDALDAANEWEMLACRMKRNGSRVEIPAVLPAYGDFEIKFNPAAGQVLGPVALLVRLGYSVSSPEVRDLFTYFKHYLISMQLNDDAHDWKEDLARGHISTAVYLLLREWQTVYPARSVIDLDADMPALEQLFWFNVLKPLCEYTLSHAARSRAALESIGIIEDRAPLERFIVRNEVIAREALAEFEKSESFLRAFAAA